MKFSHSFISILLATVLMTSFLPSSSTQIVSNETDESSSQIKGPSEIVQETINFLNIIDDQLNTQQFVNKNVILIAGFSHSGKKIVSQFLSSSSTSLESYWSEEENKFSIRDLNQDNHSQNLYGDFLNDEWTQTTFYTLPDLSSTRNLSTEIATAYSLSKVLSAINRLKIIFLISSSSFDQVDPDDEEISSFPRFMRHITKWLNYPSKYSQSLGLIVTKVSSFDSTPEIVQTVGQSLLSFKNELDQLELTSQQRKIYEDLLDSFLKSGEEDGVGFHSHIGIFREPDQAGPLDEISIVQSEKGNLQKIIRRNIQFQQISSGDFSLSNKNFMEEDTPLMESLQIQIEQNVRDGAQELAAIQNRTGASSLSSEFLREQNSLQWRLERLHQGEAQGESEFFINFKNVLTTLKGNGTAAVVSKILRSLQHLTFTSHLVRGDHVPRNKILNLMEPLTTTVNSWVRMAGKVRDRISKFCDSLDTLTTQIWTSYKSKTWSDNDGLKSLDGDLTLLITVTRRMSLTKSLEEGSQIVGTLSGLSVSPDISNFDELGIQKSKNGTDEGDEQLMKINLTQLDEFKPQVWIMKFDSVIHFVQKEGTKLALKLSRLEWKEEVEKLKGEMRDLRSSLYQLRQQREVASRRTFPGTID